MGSYGHFDEAKKEYVITKPDTPAAWANYLGSPEYGAIISNNAGGYSFVKSGANGRIIRYRFNGLDADAPGRYVYIRDRDSRDFWTNSWAPVKKPLDSFRYECRHGTAYTTIKSEYDKIESTTRYYVPLDATYEVWATKITNNDSKPRNLDVTGFVEFTNESNYEQDQVNLQYTLFISRTYFKDKFILQKLNENFGDPGRNRFFGLSGAAVSAYCGDRDKFVGRWRGYDSPEGIEKGLTNDLNYNTNSCGALTTALTLQPGESKEFVFTLGQKTEAEAGKLVAKYEDVSVVDGEIDKLIKYWHGQLNHLQVHTPDDAFNNMLNVWNAYQCFITFIWSRAASFIYCGLRNGYGYRDTVQDIQGIIHLAPELAREQIIFMLSAQTTKGAGLPLVKFDHKPGHEDTPDDASYADKTGHPSYRADDALWLFPTIYKYVSESGDTAFLDKQVVFANSTEPASVYEHLKRAIDFSMNNLGSHKMPAGLHADWNDCLRLGKKGESTFVAFQLLYAIKLLRGYAVERGDTDYAKYLGGILDDLNKALADCWHGDRWIRGYKEDGTIIGQASDKEASMWLNPQSWAVISGASSREQAIKSLDTVYEQLNTPYGVQVMHPPIKEGFDGALMRCFNDYTKENAGIFSQTQGWVVLAESLLGRGDRAFEYWKECAPAYYNDDADRRVLEPYVHGQFVEAGGRASDGGSPFAGRAHVHWLTGTASTVMVGMVEGILGLRPETKGIVISPAVPSDWGSFTIEKIFRAKKLHVTVNNVSKTGSGVKSVTVNGKKIDGELILDEILLAENNIIIEI